MKLKLHLIFGVIICCLFIGKISYSQISYEGKPLSYTYNLKAIPDMKAMPSIDLNKLKEQDAFESQFKDIPPRFGNPFSVNFGMANSGTWETAPDGSKIWRLTIKCNGAFAINLIFDRFYLPMGSSMYVYNKTKDYTLGAFTYLNNVPEKVFSTAPVKGDEITIEYNSPWYITDQPEINISTVVHCYKDLFKILKDFGDSGPCEINVICPQGDPYRYQIRGAGMLMTSSNSRFCSGSLINNTKFDGTPYFLTANHCWSSTMNTSIVVFRYESPTCSPSAEGPLTYTISGTTTVAKNSASDFCLLKLSSRLPVSYNAYFIGWNRQDIAATSGFGVHHPECDVKKISFSTQAFQNDTWSGTPANSHWRVYWAQVGSVVPVTEPGSSGSPILDQNKRIVGQLHGGPSSCSASPSNLYDQYGKLSMSWDYGTTSDTRLKDWLDSLNTGALYIDGFDPNSGPLNTFNLQTPAAGTTVTTISNSSVPYTFNWDTSTAAASYKWIFGTSLPIRQITIPTTSNTFTITLGQLDNFLAGIGLAQGDSITGAWDVWAFRNNLPQNDSLKATNGPRTIKFKRQKPLLTSFNLIYPVNNARVLTQSGLNSPIVSSWTKSGTGVKYKWFYASPNFNSLSNIKLTYQSDNSGFDSTLTKSSGEWDAAIAALGINPGDSTVGQWRVYAYSGNDSLAASQTFSITFKRVPIGNYTIGTGTTSLNFPFTTYWHDGRSQMVYTKTELLAAGAHGNLITRIGFNILTFSSQVMNGFNIKMAAYSDSIINTGFVTANMTTVYSGTYTVPGTGWQYIDLTTPFPYNPSQNLLVEVCFDNTSYTTNTAVAGTSTLDQYQYNRHIDNGTGCSLTSSSGYNYTGGRPNIALVMNLATGIENPSLTIPETYSLSQNFPNPFNPTTKINFAIPKQGFVSLRIFDILGREVKTLVNGMKQPGNYSVDFNASELSSGIYFYKLESNEFTDIKKMVLIK